MNLPCLERCRGKLETPGVAMVIVALLYKSVGFVLTFVHMKKAAHFGATSNSPCRTAFRSPKKSPKPVKSRKGGTESALE